MSEYRIPSDNSTYSTPKAAHCGAIYYCQCLPLWLKELQQIEGGNVRSVSYDGARVQTSRDGDSCSSLAMRRYELEKRVDTLKDIAKSIDTACYDWIIKGCCYGMTFDQLKAHGLPYERNAYYERRRRFLYKVSRTLFM